MRGKAFNFGAGQHFKDVYRGKIQIERCTNIYLFAQWDAVKLLCTVGHKRRVVILIRRKREGEHREVGARGGCEDGRMEFVKKGVRGGRVRLLH